MENIHRFIKAALRLAFNILYSLDQLLNTILLGNADETLSSRLYRNRYNGWQWGFGHWLVNKLFFWQDVHCKGSFRNEFNRRVKYVAENRHLTESIK